MKMIHVMVAPLDQCTPFSDPGSAQSKAYTQMSLHSGAVL